MQIKDIRLVDVANGKNWRLFELDDDEWSEQPMEEWRIEVAEPLQLDDHAVYSTVYVLEDGTVEPLLMVKEVSSPEYGGDYCEHVDGNWRQVGLVPNPDAPVGTEYVASPHPDDPSFSDHAGQARNFALHVVKMRRS